MTMAEFRLRVAEIRRHWLARVQVGCLGIVLAAAVAVSVTAEPGRTQRAAFAVPALPSIAWRVEVAEFAARLERAFKLKDPIALEFSGWILEASRRHEVSPELMASVIFTESSFRKNVVSHAGAIGPAQVQPFWRAFCGATSLEDPAENIYCGAQILAYLRDVCGDERCALAAYNVGLRNHRESEAHQQAGHRYVRKVERHLADFDSTQVL